MSGTIVISSSRRRCFYKESEGARNVTCHPTVNTGDLGEWCGDHLVWRGRQDDVVKMFGKSVIKKVCSLYLVSDRSLIAGKLA